MIGLSVSFCIKDVIEGRVNLIDIERIVGATKAPDPETWDEVIEDYQKIYWRYDPERAARICRNMIAAGKIEQPRIDGRGVPDIHDGWWVFSEEELQRRFSEGKHHLLQAEWKVLHRRRA